MKRVVMLLLALSMVAGAGASAFARSPKTKADCEKAGMTWDEATSTCK